MGSGNETSHLIAKMNDIQWLMLRALLVVYVLDDVWVGGMFTKRYWPKGSDSFTCHTISMVEASSILNIMCSYRWVIRIWSGILTFFFIAGQLSQKSIGDWSTGSNSSLSGMFGPTVHTLGHWTNSHHFLRSNKTLHLLCDHQNVLKGTGPSQCV